ncbi:MAG: arabinose-5-phosphate isomerase [Verrucomicrobiales bacterium]|jgi:arabinose-5-phosphate isomerase
MLPSLQRFDMDYLEKAKRVISIEIDELKRLLSSIGDDFTAAIDLLKSTVEDGHKIVIVGIGKSHNIGHKICATLNSTGATCVVLNSQNALHGDLGIVNAGDTVIALSYSGETEELLRLLPHLRRAADKLIAITGASDSSLARNSDIHLDTHVEREACPHNLAPTSSSTVMLVLGDALAMVLLEARGFQRDDFAKLHPGGSLGKHLLTRVSDIMRKEDQLAIVHPDDLVMLAIQRMTTARCGATVVTNPGDGTLAGIFTQGDFARAFQADPDIATKTVSNYMTPNPVSITADKLAAEALNVLSQHRVDDLVVLDENGHPVGLVDTQDFTRLKIV